MNVIYHAAISLDGYIADTSGGVGWLEKVSIDHEDTGLEAFFASVDGLLMGRKTYDFVHEFGSWPYEDKPTWVCTRRELTPLEGCNLQAERAPLAALEAAERNGVETIWLIGGGQIARELVAARRLTHVSVSVMPVVLGTGIGLFDALPEHLYLRQERVTERKGMTQLAYRIESSEAG